MHDSIIEERIQRERPCRTLFIRNIKASLRFKSADALNWLTQLSVFLQYETSSEDVRRLFEEHGDIKTFFDLIANRGMVFVTFVGAAIPGSSAALTEVDFSMISVLQKEQGTGCKARKSAAVLCVIQVSAQATRQLTLSDRSTCTTLCPVMTSGAPTGKRTRSVLIPPTNHS